MKALAEVLAERERQDDQWGGPEHDDKHSLTEWLAILGYKFGHVSLEALSGNMMETRYRAIQVAAVALAVAESIERKIGDTTEKAGGK